MGEGGGVWGGSATQHGVEAAFQLTACVLGKMCTHQIDFSSVLGAVMCPAVQPGYVSLHLLLHLHLGT